jgi:transcriptional regulator with XRE-family HTH domain
LRADAKEIGEKLRALRGERPQQEVADAVGVSAMSISKYERGESMPTDDVKIALSRFYGQTVQDIFFADN